MNGLEDQAGNTKALELHWKPLSVPGTIRRQRRLGPGAVGDHLRVFYTTLGLEVPVLSTRRERMFIRNWGSRVPLTGCHWVTHCEDSQCACRTRYMLLSWTLIRNPAGGTVKPVFCLRQETLSLAA